MHRRAILVTSVAFVIGVVSPAWRAAGAHVAFRSSADNARHRPRLLERMVAYL